MKWNDVHIHLPDDPENVFKRMTYLVYTEHGMDLLDYVGAGLWAHPDGGMVKVIKWSCHPGREV